MKRIISKTLNSITEFLAKWSEQSRVEISDRALFEKRTSSKINVTNEKYFSMPCLVFSKHAVSNSEKKVSSYFVINKEI